MPQHNAQLITPEAQALMRVAEQDWKWVEKYIGH